ncbi:hypothetical protein B0I00_3394 [Novosphingobium kunmingense]|uniref:DUF5681 domain-containing protein n=1 Tax=Novosphingobium kunmingense TaxID=1211806 RepID=A0A2N0H341_9SPHN|nr:hypothetical protein [Novosphingobium kunmingense]PKB13355.1 hypothetical protein B0I00_3394 [Novosphingobium kunmingense]
MNDDEDEVGYRKPPRSGRIKPGEVRNPNGRRGKKGKAKDAKPKDNSLAAIIDRIDNEEVEINNQKMTKRELELRVLHGKALKGDTRASAHLEKLRSAAAVADGKKSGGGVLLLPADVPLHEWTASVAIQQAPYRGAHPSYILDGLPGYEGKEEEEEDDEE